MFVNCPFDSDYAPILQGILFCLVHLGFAPRIALERSDSGEFRLDKIRELIESCKYSIHDLSRCQSAGAQELYRLNMPFELGLDYGCRRYFGHGREDKKILVLEEQPHRYQAAISDLAGCDILAHGGNYQTAMAQVRRWLVSEAKADAAGPSRIVNAYFDFQQWNYQRLRSDGWSDADILDLPVPELLQAMQLWRGCQ